VFTAPGNEAARPALTFLPASHPQGEAKSWFGYQVLAMAQAAGKVSGATEILGGIEYLSALCRDTQPQTA
jgi:hypothetical protein